MNPSERATRVAVAAAIVGAGLMIAFQMAAKATRDALFLSSYDVAMLPRMVIAAAIASLLAALAVSRWIARVGPIRFVPAAFAASAGLLMVEWALVGRYRGPVAIALYLHYGALGAVLVSGFWSVVNERFDPRTAKRVIGRITAGATVGGVAGGLLAERVAALASDTTMLPILAGIHLAGAFVVYRVRPISGPSGTAHAEADETRGRSSGLSQLASTPYLQGLVALVLLVTVSEVLIDYVFKASASARFGRGEDLLRFFAAFYTGASLLTVLVQAAASRVALQRLGLTRTVSLLPLGVVGGAAGALAVPGLGGITAARAIESVLRNGLYRAGYELLFTPVPTAQKRATKTLVDVGVVRLGDMTGGAVVQLLLLVTAAIATTALLGLAIAIGIVAAVVAVRLHAGYVRTLERSLLSRAIHLDLDDVQDAITRTAVLRSGDTTGLSGDIAAPAPGLPTPAPVSGDPELHRIAELRSGDSGRVRAALAGGPLSAGAVPHAIALLAWDDVVHPAIRALRAVAPAITGQLTDHLLDPDEEFSVRRRIPLVLASCTSDRAVDGLFRGLEDSRFEVRYRCGRALSRIREQAPELEVSRRRTYTAVLREVAVDRGVWQSHRLLDRMEDEDWSPVMDELLRERANRSLEHVFTMLSLVLPRQALKVAFRGLHTDDQLLRGTALEYLESALPDGVRRALWPFLEDTRPRGAARRSAGEVLTDLLASNQSIAVNLERLRKGKKE